MIDRVEIGRKIREQNAGPVEALSCKQFNLKQVGGSRTKVDGQHIVDGTRWSIKNAASRSTQVHLTTKRKFTADFQLNELQAEFVNKFFGDQSFNHMDRNRYKMDEIAPTAVDSFKSFLEANRDEFIRYVVCGKDDIQYVVYNGSVMSTESIMERCRNANWSYNNTAIHLKDPDGKTFFHIQMKGSGKGTTYHGVLCHIHEHLFNQKETK
tara:strand:- start:990 stop:1619 length:630 start_codon:yes stop_codon:yes gene_type:complete